jgi:tyrosine-specific transport protein
MSVVTPHRSETPLATHQGVFRRELSLFQGTALITSSIIGAGVLGIPYAVAQSGVLIGLAYILGLGLLMMGLNLMLGEVAMRTGQPLQLAGLAGKYLGPAGKLCMTVVVYSLLFGALLIYLIGEGEALAALFGGRPVLWSLGFFAVAGTLVAIGLRTIKTVELFLTFGILIIVLLIAFFSVPHIDIQAMAHTNLAKILFPYGVILFALHGTTAIPEAYSLLRDKKRTFHRAIILSMAIVMIVYAVFAVVVVGVSGSETTQIATIGLGQKMGPLMLTLGNVFAIVAMGTCFLMVGVSLRDSLQWDFRLPRTLSTGLVLFVPVALFLLGLRQFIAVLDIIGGVFGSIELLLIIAIYWVAKRRHSSLLTSFLLLTFTLGAVYSVVKLF